MEKDKALPVLTRLGSDEIAALKKQEDKKQAQAAMARRRKLLEQGLCEDPEEVILP